MTDAEAFRPDPVRHSQKMRQLAPEADPLRLGVGWSKGDLDKPWVLIETAGGDSHPCASHLQALAQDVRDGVLESGGAPGRFDCTDMCDGVAQGTDAMDLSLASRDLIAMAVELHAKSGHFDGMVLLSGGDKSQPAHWLAAAHLDIPVVLVPGGVGDLGPSGFSLERVGAIASAQKRGEITEGEYGFLCDHACASAGSCSFFGTSGTMQLLTEALGLALPGSALRPSHLNLHRRGARAAGNQLMALIASGLTPRKILMPEAFHNALVVHAASGGSSNAILHLLALARLCGVPLALSDFAKISDVVPFLLNVRPSGVHANHHVWYAGGAMGLMRELKPWLKLDALTVTGKNLGDNLEGLEAAGFFQSQARFLENFGLKPTDVIRPVSQALSPRGATAVLTGTLAPEGSVMKRSAVVSDSTRFVGPARVFVGQEAALEAIFAGRIVPGDCVVIVGEGPKGSGMPEMFYVTEALATDPQLASSVALVTDGRFSGATRGPMVGHVCPEWAEGGPLAALTEGDLIEIDWGQGALNVLGGDGLPKALGPVDPATLPLRPRGTGLLGMYQRLALPASLGGALDVWL